MHNIFLEKYGGLDLYDENLKRRFFIDNEELQFDKNEGWTLIELPGEPDGSMTDHEYFSICEDIFDKIQ